MNETRIEKIRRALATLEPVSLDIRDDSARHAGHEGAKDGRGHFHCRIVSARFRNQSVVARHRLVFAALGDLMNTDIHAFSIEAFDPEQIQP